jgi:hypothetical protein
MKKCIIQNIQGKELAVIGEKVNLCFEQYKKKEDKLPKQVFRSAPRKNP